MKLACGDNVFTVAMGVGLVCIAALLGCGLLILLSYAFILAAILRIPSAEGRHLVVGVEGSAKSLQSCPTLCDPIDGSPPGFPLPGILQARTLEWVAISFSNAGK